MEEIIDEPAELMEHVAALGIGKTALTACVRVPHQTKPRTRLQKARNCTTTTRSLPGLRHWLLRSPS